MSATELQAHADNARRRAADYRADAATATEYWRERWLKSAQASDEHADFYEQQARNAQ